MRYVALLRGINVGGNKKIAMADLRKVVELLEYTDVETLLQSGNVLFTAKEGHAAKIEKTIEHGIAQELKLDVQVMLRSGTELEEVIEANPFPDAVSTPAHLHVAFLTGPMDAKRLGDAERETYAPDLFAIGDRAIYLWYVNGAGRSKLATALTERRLGVAATARNWNTVTKLRDLLRR